MRPGHQQRHNGEKLPWGYTGLEINVTVCVQIRTLHPRHRARQGNVALGTADTHSVCPTPYTFGDVGLVVS